jgi:hypothetical protein
MFPLVSFEILVRLYIIFPELFDDILTNVAVAFFDLPRDLELVLRRYSRHLSTLPHEVQDELGDVTPCNGNVLDCASDYITLSAGDNMGDAISRINNCPRKRAIGDSVRRPRSGKRKDRLYSYVESFDIK